MEPLSYLEPGKAFKWTHASIIVTAAGEVITVPHEPVTKPSPVITPQPDQDEDNNPWVYPQPLINPTPKALKFLRQ